ncbi:MAG: YbaB/EbfC family nucleoid-associated protein [Dactylosporangium sp.]|nr:YbaB/EbfC family nucleoid-associated protein [Dactylosporangium sp.]NNJ60778.1 YbaB/EbfC family nucleoid-associated protein [Dactylosporangium sp.]
MAADPREQLQSRLDVMLDDAHRLLGSAAEMQRKLGALTVSTRSEDGYVVTTVDARGRMTQIDLDPRIYRAPNAGALSALIIETYTRAVDAIEQDTRAILKEYLPEELDIDKFVNVDFERIASRSGGDDSQGARS